MKALRTTIRAAALGLLLSSCAEVVDHSVSKMFEAESQYSTAQANWLDADLTLLHEGCDNIKSIDRNKLLKDQTKWNKIVKVYQSESNLAGQSEIDSRLAALQQRLAVCKALPHVAALIHGATDKISSLDTTQKYAVFHQSMSATRQQIAQVISQLPTPLLKGSNFSLEARDRDLRAHKAALAIAGDAAAAVVNSARDASGVAVKAVVASSHENDKANARHADERYSRATNALGQVSQASTPDDVFSAIDEVFSDAEESLAFSTAATSGRAVNPIGDVADAVPVATFAPFTATPEPEPTQIRNPVQPVGAAYAASAMGGGEADLAWRLIASTHSIHNYGADSEGCSRKVGLMIRFSDEADGPARTCALTSQAQKGQLSNGQRVMIIPTARYASGQSADSALGQSKYALLYAFDRSRTNFVGTLPGDGGGGLQVFIDPQTGTIVEKTDTATKHSLYSDGKLAYQ